MKKFQLFILTLSVSIILNAQSEDTIYIDMGAADNISQGAWNNITSARTGSASDLINRSGINTGIALTVSDQFNGINSAGLAADESLKIPSTASGDSFFGNVTSFSGVIEPTGGITLSNLDITVPYSFAIFASREATDNRETRYVATGASSVEASLDVASNISTEAVITDVYPAADGTITIIASPGENNTNSYKFFYMGVVKIFFENKKAPPPASINLTSPNGGEVWELGKTPTISWISTSVSNVDLEYTIDNGANWISIASNVSAIPKKYEWAITGEISDNCMVRISNNENHAVGDSSDAFFSIIEDDGKDYHVVVLGSSTAAGTGPSVKDSAWVWMYREHLNKMSTNYTVSNLAVGGYTTYDITPTGYINPDGVSKTGDPAHNITKALSLHPDAIIINLPSNDAASNYPVVHQLVNYDTIAKLADYFLVPLWVCTPQPRNLIETQDQIQLDMLDSTFEIFGDLAIDFYTGMYEDDGTYDILDAYDIGDGVHLNNAGHKVLLDRVIGAEVDAYIEARPGDYFVIRPESISVRAPEGSAGIINIISDLDWTVTTDASWLDLSVSSGTDDAELIVTANSTNLESNTRNGTITLSPAGLDDVVITARHEVAEYFSLTVVGGTGSGDYIDGTIVNIVADNLGSDDEFDKWTGDTETVENVKLESTELTMPATNIVVTATFITNIELQSSETGITIYPNPVDNIFYIRNVEGVSSIDIFNMNGIQMMNITDLSEDMAIDVSELAEGVYIVRAKTNKKVQTLKLVK